jgi:RNA polymerase sigma-70 factor, ECF subfamily
MLTDARIEAAHAKGLEAWPAVAISLHRFKTRVQEAAVTEQGLSEHGSDFLLASAAGDRDVEALALIDKHHIARLPGRIRRLGSRGENVPDVLQTIRERLFAGDAPRIRAYNATGPLAQWIKVVGIRTAIDFHRREPAGQAPHHETGETTVAAGLDAASLLIRSEHKRELEGAIRHLLGSLPRRDRTVLRLHLVEGTSIDHIARIYGVHRVTVARWVWNAGEILIAGLTRHFKDRLGILPPEFESLARVMRSGLSLDLASWLRD